MAISLNTNTTSIRNANAFARSSRARERLVQRLASGDRVGSASEDVVRHGSGERLDSDIRVLIQAKRNVDTARSLFRSLDGSFGEVIQLHKRMKELAVQGASDTLDDDSRASLNADYLALAEAASQALEQTVAPMFANFGWDGSGGQMRVIVDAGLSASSVVEFDLASLPMQVVDSSGAGVDSAANALNALSEVGFFLEDLTSASATLGGWQNRLEQIAEVIDQKVARLAANRSSLMDADFALVSAELARNEVVRSSALSVLAQSNKMSQSAVRLLG